MPLSLNINTLIADADGLALKEFLKTPDTKWAANAMLRRYGQAPPDHEVDLPTSWASRCFDHLVAENRILRGWFTDSGKLSPLLQAPFLAQLRAAPMRDGLGWDFKLNGDGEPEMQQFKGTLIYIERCALAMPLADRDMGNLRFAAFLRLARAAYESRAALHPWRPAVQGTKVLYDGAELAKRWVAMRVHSFMVQLGADPYAAWEGSKCRVVFGPVDEINANPLAKVPYEAPVVAAVEADPRFAKLSEIAPVQTE